MRTRPRYEYEMLHPTNHWRIIDGVHRRDWVARRSDGELRLVSIRDEQ